MNPLLLQTRHFFGHCAIAIGAAALACLNDNDGSPERRRHDRV